MRNIVAAVALTLVSSLPLAAQSVPDIYAAMANNAARAAQERAAIRSQMVTDLFALPIAILERQSPPPPVWVAPPPVVDFEQLLRDAFAYQKEQALARQAAIEAAAAAIELEAEPPPAPVLLFLPVADETADCGVRPVRPVRPVGCHGELVAQCVTDANGNNPHWVWICSGK